MREGLQEDDMHLHVVADRDHGPSPTTLSTNLGLSSVGTTGFFFFFSLLLEGMESVSRIPGTPSFVTREDQIITYPPRTCLRACVIISELSSGNGPSSCRDNEIEIEFCAV